MAEQKLPKLHTAAENRHLSVNSPKTGPHKSRTVRGGVNQIAPENRRPLWFLTKDGDRTILTLYERHYSAYQYRDGRARNQFVGPGEHIVLRTDRGDAGFVWRRFIDDSGQRGVNCAFFRNESGHLSSELVRQADAIADFAWPGARHYTYVDQEAVRSTNPGFCFMAAGWRRLSGLTGSGKHILERAACTPTGAA